MLTWNGMITTIDQAANTAVTMLREAEKKRKQMIFIVGGIVAVGVILFLKGK